MRIGVYPGSFDPTTRGHLDIIERGSKLVDKLVVGVLNNSSKKPMFSTEQRIQMLKKATEHLPNVEVCAFQGLLVDFMREQGAGVVIRGLRVATDFEYELQMAQANRSMLPAMETIFLATSAEQSFISSTLIKDILRYGGDVEQFVPDTILNLLYDWRKQKNG